METHTERVKATDLFRFVFRSRQYEHAAPFIWGFVWGGIVYLAGIGLPAESKAGLLSAAITGGSIIFGFLSTSMVLLLAFNSQRMERLKNSGYIADLIIYLREAIYLALVFVAINLAGFFLNAINSFYAAVWGGVLVAAFLSFRRILRTLIWLMKQS